MTDHEIIERPTSTSARDVISLRIGGVCAIVGAIAFATFRTLHGDIPGADAHASLSFVASQPIYAGVHIGAVFAALLTLAGLIALANSLTHPGAWAVGRFGVASSLVGLAIFSVESTSEGLALPELAHAAANASPDQQAELARAAHAVLAGTHGPSLVGVAILALDTYPTWLGWAGIIIGATTLTTATGQYLNPDLMPGAIIYGVLASILAQLWLIAIAVVMLRRARHTTG